IWCASHRGGALSPLDLVLSRLERVHQSTPTQWSARCPAHDDRNPSLSIALGDDGCVLLTCHRRCGLDAICAALGISKRDLFPSPPDRLKHVVQHPSSHSFSAETARGVWQSALERARNDDHVGEDADVYAYLRRRDLDQSWEHGAFGIVAEGMDLPAEVAG